MRLWLWNVKKAWICIQAFDLIGRGEKIRTSDPLHPMQVRYQAAPRSDEPGILPELSGSATDSVQYFQNFGEFLTQRKRAWHVGWRDFGHTWF